MYINSRGEIIKINVSNFIEEITSNFSELFVEIFLLRYLSKFIKKLKNIGYLEEDISVYLK